MSIRETAAAITRAYQQIDEAKRIITYIRHDQKMPSDNPAYFPLAGLATVHPKSPFDGAGHDIVFRKSVSIPISPDMLIQICEDRISELEASIAALSRKAVSETPA